MKKFAYSFAGLVLAASAAHAQPAPDPAGDALPPESAIPAEPATPAEPAEPAITATAEVTDADIDSFAQATVRLQQIQADATIADDEKQVAMQAAVTESGLDPEKYNAIGRAAQDDPELRAKVQTAMARHVSPSDG